MRYWQKGDTVFKGSELLRGKWGKSGIYWHYVPDWNLNIGTAPKAGCQTLKHTLIDEGLTYYSGWPQSDRRVWIVREPIARFKSLWKNKCRDEGKIARGTDDPTFSAGWSIDQLLDTIESGLWNHHWAQQSAYENGRATEIITLEGLWDWMGIEGKVRNTTEGDVELTQRQLERVKEFYKSDLELYERGKRGNYTRI
jgi:hypothetical protein